MKKILSERLGQVYEKIEGHMNGIQEIRLRSNQPLMIRYQGKDQMIDSQGRVCGDRHRAFKVFPEDIQESMAYICQYSLYAYEDEIRQGFITVKGGHRVGVTGQVVQSGGQIQGLRHVTALNIRVSHQVRGCGEALFPSLWGKTGPCHTLILSPPGGGKTTLLRDLVRLFSDGFGSYPGMPVSLIDERSEVGAGYMGIPQNDLGRQTDVLDGCPKAEGIRMMVRSMGPRIIAFDELGGREDVEAVIYALHSGCKVLTTLHGEGMEDVRQRFGQRGIFERYIFLSPGSDGNRAVQILDQNGRKVYGAA